MSIDAGASRWPVPIWMDDADPPERAETIEPPSAFDETADDVTLARAAAAGQPDAFDLIVERHQRAIYAVCFRFVGHHDDARDLTQEVFLRAYRALGRFRGQASLGTWLYRIAVNVALNRLSGRRVASEPLQPDRHIDHTIAPPDRGVVEAERASAVRAAIARLPRKQRATVILRVYQELPHEEIARILGSSVGAVKANFFHALNNLRRALKGRE